MRIQFFGAAGSVTGSCYLIDCGPTRFLVDCGMFQGNKTLRENNYRAFAFDPGSISFVLVTHAHIDHSGLLPKLVKHGFKGPIFGTGPTVDLVRYLLPDSARIQESEVEQKNRRNERKTIEPLTPIYSTEDAEKTLLLLKVVDEKGFKPGPGVTVTFRNAGHIIGSAFLDMVLEEGGKTKHVVFSGDLGSKDHPIVRDPDTLAEADVVILESTYGNRLRPPDDKEARLTQLAKVVNGAVGRSGNLIIPAFAVERTQDLLHDLMILMDRKSIPEVDVTVDSPLAKEATKVYAKYPECYDDDAKMLLQSKGNLFDHARFKFTESAEDSKALNRNSGAIILSASGMCDAGRIKHHLKHNLWRTDSTILFVGYQAEGTLGRLLLDGEKTVRIHGEEVAVAARIEEMSGYSGHADQKGLLEWLGSVKTLRDRVILTHGEDDSRAELARKIKETQHHQVLVPAYGETYDFLTAQVMAAPRELAQAMPVAPAVSAPSARPTPPEAPRGKAAPPAAWAQGGRGPKGRIDSYNVYASLMLKLAEFMRSEKNEDRRRSTLDKVMSVLGRK